MTEKIRVMLVDDHSLCRNGLKELLEHRGGMSVVSTTGDPDLVAPLLQEHHPDLLLHSWNKVKIILTTHTEGGVTENDFNLAHTIDTIRQ